MDNKPKLLDKRMLITLTFFVVAWAAFNYENHKAMTLHSARLAAVAAALNSTPDPEITMPSEDGGVTVDEAGGTMPAGTSDRRMGSSSGKMLPPQSPEEFSGVLEKVDTGCFADGECYVVVGGKHVTVLWGWTDEVVGSVRSGEGGIGALEMHIGAKLDVYANLLADGTYTLYGNSDYYIELPNR